MARQVTYTMIEQQPSDKITITQSIEQYLETLRNANSDKTVRTYRTALNGFCRMLAQASQSIDPGQAAPQVLDVQYIDAFIAFLDNKSPATEKLYLTAVRSFYAYLEDEGLGRPNLGKIQRHIQQRTRKAAWAPEVFPREGIEKLITYAENLADQSTDAAVGRLKSEAAIRAARRQAHLRNLRDRALILVLADTGLRVAEACSLTYGQVDALEARFRSVRRKGYKRKGEKLGATVLVSERALAAIRDYQAERKNEARPAGMKTRTVPLFMRHDPGAAEELRRLSEKSAWEIVKERAKQALGAEAAEQIHPHSFRHYFVTVVLLATDLETARRLAGHASTDTTAKYAEIDPEVEERYHKIFNPK
jgi:site-specific recombinase XerD